MNINPATHVHSEMHHITNCMHEHHTSLKSGASFKAEIQLNKEQEPPQTLKEAINELVAINREIDSKHKIFGTGNTLGNIVSDTNGEGQEVVTMLMPDSSAEARKGSNGQLQVSPDMINELVMPRKSSLYPQAQSIKEKSIAISSLSEYDTTSKNQSQNKKRKFIQLNFKGINKRVRKWLQVLQEKSLENNKSLDINKKEMKPLTQEYILDSYDKNGQYYQVEKQGIIDDSLNQKA